MFKQWILDNLEWLISVGVIPPIIWFATKRHFQQRELKDQDVNIESNQSEVVSKNLELYQRMLDDVEERYQKRLTKQDELLMLQELEIKELRKRIKYLEENC